MKKTYVTFGQIHVHSVNGKTFDKNCVAVIDCNSYADGREKAFEYFGAKFGTSYFDTDWKDETLKWFPRGLINVNGQND